MRSALAWQTSFIQVQLVKRQLVTSICCSRCSTLLLLPTFFTRSPSRRSGVLSFFWGRHSLLWSSIIGFTLFLYAKANEVLSVRNAASLLGWKFWLWTVIPVFCTSFFMKWYYPHRDFHRKWDYIAVAACLVYIVGIISCGWTNDVKLGLASLSLAIVYVPFEVLHY